jgi:hypothetical protein
MKKYIYIILGILVFFSCDDSLLDKKPLDKYSEKDIWVDPGLTAGFLYNVYGSVISGNPEWVAQVSDNFIIAPWAGVNNFKSENIDNSYDGGWNIFGAIRKCNLAIENIEKSEFVEATKNQLLGEAYFLRAYTNFSAARKFGGIILVDKVLSPNEADFKYKRATEKETYDYIIADFTKAAKLLPVDAPSGRASKAAALAMNMKVGLRAAAYLGDNSYAQLTINNGDSLFAIPKYELVNNYADLFNTYSKASNNKESILIHDMVEKNNTYGGTIMQYIVPNAQNHKMLDASHHPLQNQFLNAWPHIWPTQDVVDDYLVTDTDGNVKKWQDASFMTSGISVTDKMYQARDNRFYASIAYDSSTYVGNLIFTRDYGNVTSQNLIGGGVGGTMTGYLTRKGLYEEGKEIFYEAKTSYCYQILRLGIAYLDYAEAALVLGDESKAQEYISKTYKTHGGFVQGVTSSGDQLWEDYKRERRVEAFMENDRYWSVLRWAKYKNLDVVPELNQKLTKIHINQDGKNYSINEVLDNGGQAPKFTKRRFYFPVPISELNANENLTPNPFW